MDIKLQHIDLVKYFPHRDFIFLDGQSDPGKISNERIEKSET